MKIIRIFYLKLFIFGGKIFSIFETACFRDALEYDAFDLTSNNY